jgi:hypothetical protein
MTHPGEPTSIMVLCLIDHRAEASSLKSQLLETIAKYESSRDEASALKEHLSDLLPRYEASRSATRPTLSSSFCRAEVSSLQDQLSESFSRYEKLKLNYEEVCRRLEIEVQALATAMAKIASLEIELEELIEIVRKDMAHRCISKNAAEDLLTLSSQMIAKDPNSNGSIDIFLHQFDWQSIHHQLSTEMTESQVNDLKNTIITIKNSYDILCSRLFLECQARVELEKILDGTKEDLESIKDQINSEVHIRRQVCKRFRLKSPLSVRRRIKICERASSK